MFECFDISVRSPSLKFLLATLFYGLHHKKLGDNNDGDQFQWTLSNVGREAHYLQLLYGRDVDEALAKQLLNITCMPEVVMAATLYGHVFDKLMVPLGYWKTFDPETSELETLYTFSLNQSLYNTLRDLDTSIDLDAFLSWPKGLSSLFFEYLYTQPRSPNLKVLAKKLHFKEFLDGELSRKEPITLEIHNKPEVCPFCHSNSVVPVIVGYPEKDYKPEEVHLYGCCLVEVCPPPEWCCKHCGLPMWTPLT